MLRLFKKYRKGIFIVTYKKEKGNKIKYLILKRKLHWSGWEFPKGGAESCEMEIETVHRELKEETGLKPSLIIKYPVNGRYKYDRKTKKDHNRRKFIGQSFSLFSVKVKPGKVKLDKREHSDFMWADFCTVYKMLTWHNQKHCLEIVNRKINL